MTVYQSNPEAGGARTPSTVSIAGEALEISSREVSIVTERAATVEVQQDFWGFDPNRSDIGVPELLGHARLDKPELEYQRLLELVSTRWINAPSESADLAIQRPTSSCDLGLQTLVNVTVDRLDRIHRFLRLWRHGGWEMWQLDLLIRAPQIGNGELNGKSLEQLHAFNQIQTTWNLPFETALALFSTLNAEERTEPGASSTPIAPLYARLFQNRSVSEPIDSDFELPVDESLDLASHAPTLQAALGVNREELTVLLARTNGKLHLENLSLLYRELTTARALGLSVERFHTFQALTGVADVFASPSTLLEVAALFERLGPSELAIDELDFLLHHRADSPHGLGGQSIAGMIGDLRETLRTSSRETSESTGAIVQSIAALFALSPEKTRALLEGLRVGVPLPSLLSESRERLLERDPEGEGPFRFEISEAEFPRLFDAMRLFHKAAMLLEREHIETIEELSWLLRQHETFGLLSPAELTVGAEPATTLIDKWVALRKWREVHSRFPTTEQTSFGAVLELAAIADSAGAPSTPIADVLAALSALTQWPLAELEALHSALKLNYGAAGNDYVVIETYLRLERALAAARRLGVRADVAAQWALRDSDAADAQTAIAQQTREAAASKYKLALWLERAAPIHDSIREKKQKALSRYLVEDSLRTQPAAIVVDEVSWPNPKYWENETDLLRFFLIDVEASPCQRSSRIKQAISSTQMFVQRCFLNLEQPLVEVSQQERQDSVSLNSWRQWSTMKSYRLWEAARKVFLYPENWLEPELRDDETPFFKDFEDELAQSEMTSDHAESAFRSYLERLHEVSSLETVAAYHEIDDDNPNDDLPASIDRFHVVARTRSEPTVYFYRYFDLNQRSWSGWEPIEANVQGEHVTLVVYNRRLYLFWLSFHKKPIEAQKQPAARPSEGPTDIPKTSIVTEVRLSWSVRKGEKWTAESLAKEKLIHPWSRPHVSYHLKPRYKPRENTLWLDVYISTSREFNNTRFYDEFRGTRHYFSASRFDESGRPWHSSSFLFDGEVIGVKMKPLRGHYHLADTAGGVSAVPVLTTSHEYVRRGFGEVGRSIGKLSGGYEIAPRLVLPEGMRYAFNRLANRESNDRTLAVLEQGSSRRLLRGANAPFNIVFSPDEIQFDTAAFGAQPRVYQDRQRAFLVLPRIETRTLGYNQVVNRRHYDFFPVYHAYTGLFLRELNRSGTDGLLSRRLQRFPHTAHPPNTFRFSAAYLPVTTSAADETAERDIVDFTHHGAFSTYNWEVFFHAPFMVATRLSDNQRFEEAMRWFHYIFDPTSIDSLESPQRFWVTKPFFDKNSEDYRRKRIEELLENIGVNLEELRGWQNDPFNPHRIARHRPIAFQKAVVMRYIDNLIAWGDQLFRRDSVESINEAMTLYVLAYELLGPRPVHVPSANRQERSFDELIADGELDPLGNKGVVAALENFIAPPTRPVAADPNAERLPLLDVPYFCIPPNDKLLEYWDRLEDRLFKIRHCMNIAGRIRALPLFQPPIDPGVLMRASAAGVDIGSVLWRGDVDPGHFRFRSLVAKALEFASDVRVLGDKMVVILERRDAEALAILRAGHEVRLLEAALQIRGQQIEEARTTIKTLAVNKESAQTRLEFYQTRAFMNPQEVVNQALLEAARSEETSAQALDLISSALSAIPNFTIGAAGFGGSPQGNVTLGGSTFAAIVNTVAQSHRMNASEKRHGAQRSSLLGSYTRRQDDWDLQASVLESEVAQIEHQLTGAELRHAIAVRELENLELQIEQSKTTEEYYKTKYTSEQLFAWMLKEVSAVYFQSYKLAFDMASRAQQALKLELGSSDLSFVEFGYWDGLKMGLLAGEKLSKDIRRMEATYLEQNRREFELTKHFSLAQLLPLKLLELKTTGECEMTLPEWFFDMDYPGHFRRRIRSISLTIPSVAGPYAGVHATLSLVSHGVRVNEDVGAGYGDPLVPDGDRFNSHRVPITLMATSHAQNDGGMFDANSTDDRFVPFEGAGAVSQWRLTLPKDSNAFDFDTISDVIIHMRYTAAPGNTTLTDAAKTALATVLPTSGVVLLDLQRGFATEWERFLHPANAEDQRLELALGFQHFPFFANNKNLEVIGLDLFIESTHATSFDVELTAPEATTAFAGSADPDPSYGSVHHLTRATIASAPATGTWRLRLKKDTAPSSRELLASDIENFYLVVRFRTT